MTPEITAARDKLAKGLKYSSQKAFLEVKCLHARAFGVQHLMYSF